MNWLKYVCPLVRVLNWTMGVCSVISWKKGSPSIHVAEAILWSGFEFWWVFPCIQHGNSWEVPSAPVLARKKCIIIQMAEEGRKLKQLLKFLSVCLGVTPASEFEEEETPDPTGETLSIVAKFQPLVMETMTKSKDGFLGVRIMQDMYGQKFQYKHILWAGVIIMNKYERGGLAPGSSTWFDRQTHCFLHRCLVFNAFSAQSQLIRPSWKAWSGH